MLELIENESASRLVDVFQEEANAAHSEKEEGPVDYPLKVLEARAGAKNIKSLILCASMAIYEKKEKRI